jgi:low affinity Fe/Cu permease
LIPVPIAGGERGGIVKDVRVIAPEEPRATSNPERLSLFQRVADKVSYGMGTPTNITVWILLVATWIALGPYFAKHSFLPGWFTSNGFNFPLNTVTTIAELYIGFLVGASSNRSERNLEATLGRIGAQEMQIKDVEDKLSASLEANTKLTEEVHRLTKLIHERVAGAS